MPNRLFIRFGLMLLVAAFLVVVLPQLAAACPTCKEGLAHADPAQKSIAAGYYYSILFMMATPFTILGTFGGLAYLSIRRAQGESSQE